MSNVKSIVANTIVITFIALLFLFAFTWIIFDFQGSASSLKDTWGIVSSLFGGLTTLAAAYIASLLYTNWRVQTKYSEQLKNISKIALEFTKIPSIIKSIRSDKSNALFLSDCYKYIHGQKTTLDNDLHFNIPNFEGIKNLINELNEALILIKVYSLKEDLDDIFTEISRFEQSLDVWMSGFDKVKNDFNEINISKLILSSPIDYVYLFCDCSSEFYRSNITELGEKYSIYNHNEIDIYHDQIAISIAIGKFLSDLENYN